MGIRLEEIATWLRTVPAVAAVFGARIWAGEPLDDSQAGPYLVLDTVSQTWDSVNNRARVELRAAREVIAVPRADGTTLYLVRQDAVWVAVDPAQLDGPAQTGHSSAGSVQVRY